jgi:protein AATF/BFR2
MKDSDLEGSNGGEDFDEEDEEGGGEDSDNDEHDGEVDGGVEDSEKGENEDEEVQSGSEGGADEEVSEPESPQTSRKRSKSPEAVEDMTSAMKIKREEDRKKGKAVAKQIVHFVLPRALPACLTNLLFFTRHYGILY